MRGSLNDTVTFDEYGRRRCRLAKEVALVVLLGALEFGLYALVWGIWALVVGGVAVCLMVLVLLSLPVKRVSRRLELRDGGLRLYEQGRLVLFARCQDVDVKGEDISFGDGRPRIRMALDPDTRRRFVAELAKRSASAQPDGLNERGR